jgi:ABC-2 type transport system ATP-binding protein
MCGHVTAVEDEETGMALVIDKLTKRYGAVQALDGIGFAAQAGQVFGFLGPNGAGKTTTMRIVLDIIHADEGSVTWAGEPAASAPRRTWGYLPEERGLYPRMKVLDQLVFMASLYGVSRAEAAKRARRWLTRFRIGEYAGRRAEELSKGNQQKVQFIGAILHDPDVLLMDEPFSGLDPINVALLKEAFLEFRDRGKAIVFSTHQMEAVEELCDAIAIIDKGRLVVTGSTREVKRQANRLVVRLGVSGDPDLVWLDTFPNATVRRSGLDYHEIQVQAGIDPESILREALARNEYVTRFEIAEPSIEDIFIEQVGAISTSERTLAAVAAEAGR